MDNAFGYIKESGICTEGDYPYTSGGGNSGTCKTACTPAATLTGFTDVANEAGMIAALNVGPVSVAVEADKSAWQFYSGGVLDDASCGTSLDHGVLAVGYGTDGKDYYNVKNSWGASWGESGYIRLVQGKNQCGIASAASYPTGASQIAPPAPTPAPAPTAPTTPAPPTTPADPCQAALTANCDATKLIACLVCGDDHLDVCSIMEVSKYCGLDSAEKKILATHF